MKFTLLVLLIAALTNSAIAVPVWPDSPNGVAAVLVQGGGASANFTVLCTGGQVFHSRIEDTGVILEPWSTWASIPVPVNQVEGWYGTSFSTISGGTYYLMNQAGGGTVWYKFGDGDLVPTLPCGTVASESESLGGVKGMFK